MTSTSEPERVCVVCGRSMDGKRKDALCCSGPCRAERGRLLAILEGRDGGPYAFVVARLDALANRARGATGGVLGRRP